MRIKGAIFTVVIAFFTVFAVLFAAIGLRQPELSAAGLPDRIMANNEFAGRLIVNNARGELSVRCDREGIEIAPETWQLRWAQPTAGSHAIRFELYRQDNGVERHLHDVTWQVQVDGELLAADPAPAGAEEIVEVHAESEQPAPAEAPPLPEAEVVEAPAVENAVDAAVSEEHEAAPEVADEPAEQMVPPATDGPEAIEAVTADPPAIPAEPVAAVELPAGAGLDELARFADEVSLQLDGKQTVYGRGRPGALPPRGSYIRGLLANVSFVYDFPDDANHADGQLDALLAIGAEYVDKNDPLAIPLNDAGTEALARREQAALRLPHELWAVVFRSAFAVSVVNKGTVKWRLARYAPDGSGYAVAIAANDIRKQ